jgi:23S rRNA (adenine2503-C2)-methyltransferase
VTVAVTRAAAPAARADLASLTIEALEAFVQETLGEPRFRARQLYQWMHKRGVRDFGAMTDLGKELRARLEAAATCGRLELAEVHRSSDGTRKLVMKTEEGHRLESVLIPDPADHDDPKGGLRDRLTLCISTQVGCTLDCNFCYTASLGLARNLRASEISDQVHRALGALDPGEKLTNVVLMGMGEPLANYAETVTALKALSDSRGLGLGARRITLSTAGMAPEIERLSDDVKVNLAVSLNATTDEQRDRIMPRVNKRYPLARLLEACRRFKLPAGRRITFEYVLLEGVNDSDDDAHRLAKLVRGIPAKVNLIPFNPHPRSPYGRPADERVRAFQQILLGKDVATSVRLSRGRDIEAACGQLGGPVPPGGLTQIRKAAVRGGATDAR